MPSADGGVNVGKRDVRVFTIRDRAQGSYIRSLLRGTTRPGGKLKPPTYPEKHGPMPPNYILRALGCARREHAAALEADGGLVLRDRVGGDGNAGGAGAGAI